MKGSILKSLLRDERKRQTDRAAFVQAMSRLSGVRDTKPENRERRKALQIAEKAA